MFDPIYPIYPGGHMPPLVKIATEQKLDRAGGPGFWDFKSYVLFSCRRFRKILWHFHALVKNYAGFVEAG